jgi:RNA-directed DNA polymerase
MFSGEGIVDRELGTPQGGIISPTLANFTLNGLEEVVDKSTRSITKSAMKQKHLRSGLKLNLAVATVRYADDFLVTARSKYLIETYILPQIVNFLKERGLELSKEKTRILTVTEGLDFLGYTFKYHEQWKVREHFFKERIGQNGIALYPLKNKVYNIIAKLREIFRESYNDTAYTLISKINPILRGWYGYYNLSQSTKYRGYVRQAVFSFCVK